MKTPTCLLVFLAVIGILIEPNIAYSQTYTPSNRIPVIDNTLGTQVSGNNNFTITGGLKRGQNLLHSFSDFSVPTGGGATFINPVGNQSIITRVTGNLFSDINGTVNTQGANFLLINPHGIVFGPNVQLNVGKAFVGSTANGIDLVDGSGRTITFGTNPNGDAPLLAINPNVFFNVSRLNMGGGTGSISNFGTLQTQNNSQYIGLIGGNVTLDGSQGGGKIIAPGGRVDIGGLNSVGTVTVNNQGLVFSNNGVGRSNVLLTNDAGVIVRATGTLGTVNTFFNNVTSNGSSINISANQLDILNSGAKLSDKPAAIDAGLELNSGVQIVATGDINIDALGKFNLNNSDIKNTLRPGTEGRIGNIKIKADSLDLNNRSIISSVTGGKGDAGNIDFKVIGDLNITSGSRIVGSTAQTAIGNAGDIQIVTTGDIKISGYDPSSNNPPKSLLSFIESGANGQGDAGKITIDTQGKLLLVDSGFISSLINETGVGNSQGISISARELELANGANIGTSTFQIAQVPGKGNAGDINIKTTGNIKVSGNNLSSITPTNSDTISFIDTNTYGQGNAGKINIDTQGKLSLVDRGVILSSIDRDALGNSPGISISAGEIELNNHSYIDSTTEPTARVNDTGMAGKIDLKVKGAISLNNIAAVRTTSDGSGSTGNVSITASRLLLNGGGILSDANSVNGGNVTLAISDLLLMKNLGFIVTDSSGSNQKNANGGDITISSPLIVALPGNSDISANATGGNGGNVTISSQGLFGIRYRPKGQNSISTNDITSSSTFGQNGNVNINTPGTDPGRDTGELPDVPTDATTQIYQACSPSQRDNKFYITGRGGHPPNASDPQESDALWSDPRATKSEPMISQTSRKLAAPAVGWVFDGKGKVMLISAQTEGAPARTNIVCPKEGE